jgi:hypothetical protein
MDAQAHSQQGAAQARAALESYNARVNGQPLTSSEPSEQDWHVSLDDIVVDLLSDLFYLAEAEDLDLPALFDSASRVYRRGQ